MKKHLLSLMVMCLAFICATPASAAITKEYGWFESAAVEWEAVSGATNYNVYVRPVGGTYTRLDKELVRKYADFYRADALGLKAGSYQMKVVPVISGSEDESKAMETSALTVTAHDRSGFAHVGMPGGIGAYKNDGTLKDGARVIYVTAKTAKTVTCNVNTGTDTEFTGLQAILGAFEKGKETRPLCIRIVGTIKKADVDAFNSSAEGIQIKGKSGSTDMNITIEGVGFDATTHGFGFLIRSAKSVELRNFANMICMDDAVSLDTDNHNVWVHNMDFFYGGTGGDADQAKGDGTVDIKGKSSHITVSYNHFYDNGKCSLGGMKSETTDCWMTYHHNWFDHSDSRHPRIRTAFYHCYNNYYDGNSKYAVGVTSGGSAFVEANYFRNVKYPMLSSKQGTDAEGDGTFSGENSGVNKAFNNVIINPRKIQYWSADAQATGAWDAVLVDNRADAVTATAFTGGTSYNSAADNAARTQYIENKMDDPEDIPTIVRGSLGAGRMEHGDFTWTFNNSLQDENYDVISDMKSTLVNYESTVQSFADGSAISDRTPATSTVNGGDGKGLDQEANDAYVPTWAGGSGGSAVVSGKQVIGENDDWFWFNADNQAQVNTYMSDGGETKPSTIMTNGTFNPTRTITNSKTGSCSDYAGSILLAAGGYLTMYYPQAISSIAFYVSGNGSQKWIVEKSVDGNTWTEVTTVEGKTATHPSVAANFEETDIKYVRVTNKATGGRDIQGVKVYTPTGASDLTKVNTANITLTRGQTYTLALGTDYTTTSTGAISYKSNATKIATVDANGKITAVAEGNATITLSQAADNEHNGAELKFTVTVSDNRNPSDLTLNSNEEITVEKGATAQISVTCSNTVTYTSGASSIATVDENGKITAVGYGTATITISDPGSTTNKPGTKTVTVNVPDNRTESNLKVQNDELTVDRNATVQINVTQHDGALTYRSVDEDIATVDADGVVTGLLAGEATIVVSDAGSETAKAGSVNVTVTVNDTRAESQLAITSGTNIEIEMANSRTATITTSGAAGALSYESSDESIASVSAEGVITGKKAGTVEITVSDAGNDSYKPGTATITVTVIPVPTLDPVTWIVNDKNTLKNGASFVANANNTFVSTDETGSELLYVAGSSCKIADGSLKMGGATQFADGSLGNRYFVLPPLTGAGTLTVTYGSSNTSDITVSTSKAKNDPALATITKASNSVRLTDLNNTVLYLYATSKAYINSITWTPEAPDTRLASEFALTSGEEVTIAVDETSAITYEKNAGTVTFESDNTDVATVSADGTITGVANGVATITVTDPGNSEYKSATKTVTVTVGTGIEDRESQTWDFTTTSSADLTALAADANWVYDSGKERYSYNVKITKNTLFDFTANGSVLDGFKGLKVSRTSDLGTGNVRIDVNNRLSLNGGSIYLVIPNLKEGDIVYVDFASAGSSEGDRTLTVTNGTGENLTSNINTDRKIGKITVTADGNLTITQNNGMNYYRIFVNPAEVPTVPTTPTGIDGISADDNFWSTGEKVFDISGRQVFAPQKGQIYIKNGKKFIKK